MYERIVIDPNICNGRPTVRGTRITAQTIMEFLAAGDSIDDVLEEYPSLTREDILACLVHFSHRSQIFRFGRSRRATERASDLEHVATEIRSGRDQLVPFSPETVLGDISPRAMTLDSLGVTCRRRMASSRRFFG
ncbi:DUF433 domain-containing protein [Deinococcus malanensis]|uniref:DUF433 domain-containing protein n=1 Tax=Deinococcus malanensis TaxID=1706855 RepID=UPI00362C41C9